MRRPKKTTLSAIVLTIDETLYRNFILTVVILLVTIDLVNDQGSNQ